MSVGERLVESHLKFQANQPQTNAPSDLHIPPADVIALMAKEGEPILTGWHPLDSQLRRSGIPPGRIVTFGGPPFSGKTTVVAQILWHMSQVCPVFALFSDEGRTQAAIRFGVMSGIPVDEIESKPAEAADKMRDLMGERSILLMKPDTEESTIAGVVKKVTETITPGDAAIIGLDSIQTIPLGLEGDEPNPRLAAKRAMAQIRKWAAEHGWIFILTSQSNRASYRSKKAEDNTLAMASFAESGAIEFMSDLALVLGTPNEAGIVKVDFVKNRLKGTMKPFSVRYDESTGKMLEVDPGVTEQENQAAATERLKLPKSKILHELKTDRSGLTTSQLAELAKVRKATVVECVAGLEFEKRVFHKKEGRQILYHAESE